MGNYNKYQDIFSTTSDLLDLGIPSLNVKAINGIASSKNGQNQAPITVTQPFLPPLDEFMQYLRVIWSNKHVTNRGQFHCELEDALCEFLGIKHISLLCNGTIALLVAIKALELKGEIITTPYSFVATSHAIKWNEIEPVFVDIESHTCNLNPDRIEEAISEHTSAILPVHVYGNPCDNNRIMEIARKSNLKVIYDAAHAFGIGMNGESILNFGDLSVLSFHATKVFNTFEGGAIVSHTAEMKKKIDDLINFAFQDEVTVTGLGINGKMNEIQAAIGLLQLNRFNEIIEKRKAISNLYRMGLDGIRGIRFLDIQEHVKYNYAYVPILIDEKKFNKSRDEVYNELKKHNIFGRRYFYPLISHFKEYVNLSSSSPEKLPVAEKISKEVICLPIYPDLDHTDVDRIIDILKDIRWNR